MDCSKNSKPSNLLVLDEPTNDLDLETLDLLQELIADYAGTVLLVSHDRDFLDRCVTSVIAFEEAGRWQEYAGGYSDMVAQRGHGVRARAAEKQAPAPKREAAVSAKPAPRKKGLGAVEQHELKTLPAKMEKLSAEKTGTLEKIKNKMRLRVFKTENVSAKAAFQKFWTWDYLIQNGWEKELKFFNQEIQPLIETNYFRPLGEDGRPIDNFEAIDFLFGTIFFWEFMLRTWWIARTHKGLRWREAMLWRWYDIFLFIPIWRWLRFIPTVIRLDQVKIINLRLIKEQAIKGLVALISKDITEIIVLRIINKIQEYIRRGQVKNFLNRSLNGGYNNLNDTNEVILVTNDTYITATQVCELIEKIAALGLMIPITLVLDNARYQKCKIVEELALSLSIELLYLPSYSPNLNLIERLWKLVKKRRKLSYKIPAGSKD